MSSLIELAAPSQWIVDALTVGPSSRNDDATGDGDDGKPSGFDLLKALAGVPKSKRNDQIFRAASSFRGSNTALKVAEQACVEAAAKCTPRFSEKETRKIVKRVYKRYPAGRQAQGKNKVPYASRKDGLYWLKPVSTRNGIEIEIPIQLTNFTAVIKGSVTYDDGVETSRRYEIETGFEGRTALQTVTEDEFPSMKWASQRLGPRALVFPGAGMADRSRGAIQLLSRDTLSERVVYTYTGWKRVEGDVWVYLHGGGGIDQHGARAGIVAELPDALSRINLQLPSSAKEQVAAIRASLMLLKVGPSRVMTPLLAGIYRVLIDRCDFSEHLAGPTGSFKTEIAALIQQHVGAEFDRLHLPGAWSSTPNALEGLCFAAKDAPVVIDDFAPTGTIADRQRLQATAERLFRAQGNASGRLRMRADLTLRPQRPPRGMIISTGEDVPGGQSLRARILVLELTREEIDAAALTKAQEAGSVGLYALAMGAYVRWLAGQLDKVRKLKKSKLLEYRTRANYEGAHAKTPGLVADLFFGWEMFIRFAQESGAVTQTEAKVQIERGWVSLCEAGATQAKQQASQEPTRRFIELISSAISSGTAYLADMSGDAPQHPESSGWRYVKRWDGGGLVSVAEPRGGSDKVGWLDGDQDEHLYLDPDASYRVAQRMAPSNEPLTVSPRTLRKRLHEKKLLVDTDIETRETYLVRRTIEGRERSVLYLNASALGFERKEVAPESEKKESEAVQPTEPDDDAEPYDEIFDEI
jgi:hypothetical protein